MTIPPSALGRIDAEHRAPAGHAERVGGFAQAVGDEQQHLLAAAGDQRQLMIASATEAAKPDCLLVV